MYDKVMGVIQKAGIAVDLITESGGVGSTLYAVVGAVRMEDDGGRAAQMEGPRKILP